MKATPESFGLKLLVELKKESDRGATLLTWRRVSEIQRAAKLTDSEMNLTFRYLVPLRAVSAVDQGTERFAALPTQAGVQPLAASSKAIREEGKANLETRMKWYAIVLTVIGLSVAVATWIRSH